jgi:hypothetical protein
LRALTAPRSDRSPRRAIRESSSSQPVSSSRLGSNADILARRIQPRRVFSFSGQKRYTYSVFPQMNVINGPDQQLSIVPLGPGDLIDRAVRFYRQNFLTFVLIAAPPVVAGTIISVGWTVLARSLFERSSSYDPLETIGYYLFVYLGSLIIWFTESVATLAVMGGASRNFVRHLLFGEPITFRETYRNMWSRIAALIVASTIIVVLLGVLGVIIFYFGLAIGGAITFLAVMALANVPPMAAVVGAALGAATVVGTVWLFFLIASRFAYVPQVMLVEGQGIPASISRSASLAGGNVKRLAALFIFSTVAVYSALAIVYVPLAWYAWSQGVEVFVFDRDLIPAWYEVASQLVWQASLILMTPVWMVGLCLLYVDERVRHEGYDIELMAARRLGDIPAVPQTYINPLQPALANEATVPTPKAREGKNSRFTTLGLE